MNTNLVSFCNRHIMKRPLGCDHPFVWTLFTKAMCSHLIGFAKSLTRIINKYINVNLFWYGRWKTQSAVFNWINKVYLVLIVFWLSLLAETTRNSKSCWLSKWLLFVLTLESMSLLSDVKQFPLKIGFCSMQKQYIFALSSYQGHLLKAFWRVMQRD